jgi:hypothetical protein
MLRSLERATILIVPLLLVATSVLFFQQMTSKREISSSDGRWAKVLDRLGLHKEHVETARTEQPDQRTLSEPPPRLVLENQGVDPADNTVPLGVQISGKAAGVTLEISGLPKGMTLSAGRRFGTEAWRVSATELGNATIYPPPELSGAVDLVVELRLADGTVVDRRTMHREWLQRPTVVTVAESGRGVQFSDDRVDSAAAPSESVREIAQQRPDPLVSSHTDGGETVAINRVEVAPKVEAPIAAKEAVGAKPKRQVHVRSSVHPEASTADRHAVYFAGNHIGADPDVNVRMALARQYSWMH